MQADIAGLALGLYEALLDGNGLLPAVQGLADRIGASSHAVHMIRYRDGRPVGSDLVNPDFVALARSFGADAHSVRDPEALRPVLDAALAKRHPAVIHVPMPLDPSVSPWRLLMPASRRAALRHRTRRRTGQANVARAASIRLVSPVTIEPPVTTR